MSLMLLPHDPRIHVFSISDGPMALAHQTYLSRLDAAPPDGAPLQEAFGADIDATYVEVFAVSDLAPLSLRDYLAQAHDIPPQSLAVDAARLDALSGDVALLAPRAVAGLARVAPRPELTHIGSYAPPPADTAPRDLPPATTSPGDAPPAVVTETPVPRRKTTWIVLAALVLLLVLAAIFDLDRYLSSFLSR